MSDDNGHDKRALPTRLIRHAYRAPSGFEAVQPGVHKASTVIFPNVAAFRARTWLDKSGYTYGLHGTPTTFTLEERIATLEGGRRTLLTPSGLSAIALVDACLLAAGDEVVLPDNVYGPSLTLARGELKRWGIGHKLYDPLDAASLDAAIGERTRLVWIEAAGSVTMEFPDLAGLLTVARRWGTTVAIDSTWGAGIAYCGFDIDGNGLGADIVVHALTKYPSGGADVLMGAVTTRDDALHEKLLLTHMRLGVGVGGNDAELVLRALPSLALRYAAQDASARRIAQWLSGRGEVARVLHPALPDAPGHAYWAAHCQAAAGLLAVQLRSDVNPARVDAFVDALKLFSIGTSWGGPASLAVPYDLGTMRRAGGPLSSGPLVRLAIGLEDTDDLLRDLERALFSIR